MGCIAINISFTADIQINPSHQKLPLKQVRLFSIIRPVLFVMCRIFLVGTSIVQKSACFCFFMALLPCFKRSLSTLHWSLRVRMSEPSATVGGREPKRSSARPSWFSFQPFIPKLAICLRERYTRPLFFNDLTAGVTVAVIALPLSLALAIGSGCKPEQGLYTAIVAGFLISALGGSRVQIGGPAGAFMAIVAGIMAKYGYEGLALSTLMAGFILILMGLARFGSLIKFIPYPVTTGFTSGIAVIIFSSQVKDFLGLSVDVPSEFLAKWQTLIPAFHTINPLTTAFAIASLTILVVMRRWCPRIPSAIIVVVLGAVLTATLGLDSHHMIGGLETVGTKFQHIPNGLPSPSLPFSLSSWSDFFAIAAKARDLLPTAATLAVLCAIESLLCAEVADGMIGGRHKSNCELVAQGVANIASIFCGGMPATGTIARTAANVKYGAKTPFSGMIHAGVLLLIMLLCAPFAVHVPLAVLASILILVAWNMAEIDGFRHLLTTPKSDVAVLLATFGLTVFTDLTIAVGSGLVLASLLFIKRLSSMTNLGTLRDDDTLGDAFSERSDPNAIANRDVPSGVDVYEINGPLFFAVADLLKDVFRELPRTTQVFILRLRRVSVIDASGLHALDDFHQKCQRQGITLLLAGIHAQPIFAMTRCGLLDTIGSENLHPNIDDALNHARAILNLPAMPRPAEAVPEVARERLAAEETEAKRQERAA
jgi:SulP family sulfate permease